MTAAGLGMIAALAAAAPARADDVAHVHSWMTGPTAATAGGPEVEFRLDYTQSGGPLFVYVQSVAVDVVPPSGAKPSAAVVEYQYFTEWKPLPLSPMELKTESVAFRNLRIRFTAAAAGGTWRLRARITDYDWSMHGIVQPGYSGEVVEQSDWFSMTVAGKAQPSPAVPAAGPSKSRAANPTRSAAPAPATPAAPAVPAASTGATSDPESEPVASPGVLTAAQQGQPQASENRGYATGYAVGAGIFVALAVAGAIAALRRRRRT